MTFGESPMAANTPVEQFGRILHVSFEWNGDSLSGADSPPGYYKAPQGFHIALNPSEPAEAERIFSALAEGGSIEMPLQETFWARRFGMLTDRFGVPWMVNCGPPAA
jgi:PhnB protein